MIIEKIDNVAPPENALVAVKMCGNVAEVKYTQSANCKARIKKIDADSYVVVATGEVRQFQRGETRLDDRQSLRESLSRLRDYLNTNVVAVSKCRWITLTYKELMTNTERLYRDFKEFNRRCRKRYGHYEYIVAAEYQGRGSLHLHCVLIFDKVAPYMANKEVAKLWGNGFVNIRKLTGVDDVGRYLTAYVGDAFFSELERVPDGLQREQIKNVEVEENGVQVKKTVIKGARLSMMPPGFNLYRVSRGIKPPTVSCMSCSQADSLLQDWALTYQKTYRLSDDNRGFSSVISTSYYNKMLGLADKKLLESAKREQKISYNK